MPSFADMLAYLRKRDGYSQTELADKLKISRSAIGMYESGKREPDFETLEALADTFNVNMDTLLGKADDIKTPPLPSNLIPARFRQAPLIGEIACGTPILAEQNIIDYIDVPEHIQCDFALKCQGRSMINLGVQDGDIVYVRSQPEVQNGQIAAVIVDGMEAEATLKKFYRYDNQIVLIPANDDDKPFVYTGEEMARVQVQGLAVGFTHVFNQ